MKNLNEQLNRMKSLMSEERLFGNLVDKKPINEWGKAAKILGIGDDVLKVGTKNADEAVDVINKAVKYFDDANIAVRYSDEMIKSVDDIATDFVKPINSSTELISHYKKYEPIYKYLYKDVPKKLKNYESYLKALESGEVTDLTKLYKGKPVFSYMPDGINMVAMKNYLNELPEEVAKKRIKTIQSSYRDYFKGKYMEIIDTGDDIGTSVGKSDDAIGGTTKGGDDAIGGTTKGTSSGVKVPTIKVSSPKQFLERVEELIGKGYVGEMVVLTEKGEAKIIVGKFDSAKGLIEASLDDLTKGMSRRQKKKFIKYFMKNGGEEIEKELSKKYISKDNVIKFLKAGLGDYGEATIFGKKLNWLIGAKKGDTVFEKVAGAGFPLAERIVKIYFVTIGLPMSIYYTGKEWSETGEFNLNHPFFFKDGGYSGKLINDLNLGGLLNWASKETWESFCINAKEATNKVFDCSIIESQIFGIQKEIFKSMPCLEDGATEEDYKNEFERLMTKSKYLGRIKEKLRDSALKSGLDYVGNETAVQNDLIEVFETYIPDGAFNGENLDTIVAAKIIECNKKRIKDNEDSDERQGYEWDEMKSSDDTSIPGGGGSQGTELPQF